LVDPVDGALAAFQRPGVGFQLSHLYRASDHGERVPKVV
jgi:hypothetical protein